MDRRFLRVASLALAMTLVAAGAASARRPVTPSERAQIEAAVLKRDQRDQLSGLAGHLAIQKQCSIELAYVSTVDPHWAVLWFRSRYLKNTASDQAKYQRCTAKGGNVDGVWVAKRTAGGWIGKGWIGGDREGFCRALHSTGMPSAAFKDVDDFKRHCP